MSRNRAQSIRRPSLAVAPAAPEASASLPSSLAAAPATSSDLAAAATVHHKTSFLSRLKAIPRPRPTSLIPASIRRHRQNTLLVRQQGSKILGVLVVRVLTVKGLISDQDPIISIRYGTERAGPFPLTSLRTVSSLSLPSAASHPTPPSPVEFVPPTECKLEVNVFDDRSFGKERIEVILKDRNAGEEYLGEVSLVVDEWWGQPENWIGSFCPLGFWDPENMPIWHRLESADCKTDVAGELLIKVGFIPLSSSNASSRLPSLLSPSQRSSLLAALKSVNDEVEGLGRRDSREERVLLTSPMEGVGTVPIHGASSLGELPLLEAEEAAALFLEESENSEDEEDDNNAYLSAGGTESGDEAEESELRGEILHTHDELDSDSDFDAEADDHDTPSSSLHPAIQSSSHPLPVIPSFHVEEPTDLSEASASSHVRPSSPPAASDLPFPADLSRPSTSSSSSPLAGITAPAPSSTSSRKGISLPQFMKRHSSARSIPFAKQNENSDSGDLMVKDSKDGDSESASASASGTGKMKERMKRFSRKKVVTAVGAGEATSSEMEGLQDASMIKKKRGLRKRITGARVRDDEEGEREPKMSAKSPKASGLARRRTKRDYQLDEDSSIFGIVQIEVISAAALPRLQNITRTGWDMDAFCVISFGKTVARTRVIRHNLNPVWNEKLSFHVGRVESESGFSVVFNVFDWDKITSNDHVGDCELALHDLIALSIAPDESGLFSATPDGRLAFDDFHEMRLRIARPGKEAEMPTENDPTLLIRAKFTPYDALRQQFWRCYLPQYDTDESGFFTYLEIFSALDSLNSTLTRDTISSFFSRFDKTVDQELTIDELIICLEQELLRPISEKRTVDEPPSNDSGVSTPIPPTPPATNDDAQIDGFTGIVDPGTSLSDSGLESSAQGGRIVERTLSTLSTPAIERVINVRTCPMCHRSRLNSKDDLDIITHLANCASIDPNAVNRLVVGSYVTASQAHQKWFTGFVKVVTRGAYHVGANSSNIIVQDRRTGTLQEEKMATYVRLGMRLAYRGGLGGGMEGPRIGRMLESMSIKQGSKFDSSSSVAAILPFIRFHNLDMSEVLDPLSSFKSFNEFFYRKLKPSARPIVEDPNVVVSPADARAVCFDTVSSATTLWIKGRGFSIKTLLGDAFKDQASAFEGGSIMITRLAPQDYHRFHSPVDGVCGKMSKISGKYFTVNPVAIRSSLDVFGENVRVVMPITSPVFGEVFNVWVGAMMVGSIEMSVKEGDVVKKGQDVGYFKFGGSTIITLFKEGAVKFDEDLLENSKNQFETLVRVGTRVGRKP